jgi:hypothetical protein
MPAMAAHGRREDLADSLLPTRNLSHADAPSEKLANRRERRIGRNWRASIYDPVEQLHDIATAYVFDYLVCHPR